MNAVTLLIVFACLLALAFVYAAKVRQRPPTYREVVVTITADLEAVKRAIGERLLPVVAEAAAAMRDFDEAFRRVNETAEVSDSE
jgi:hypothetical protein